MDGDLPPQRRKDLMSSLMLILKSLFKFFIQTLQCSADKIKQMVSKGTEIYFTYLLLPVM